MGRLIKEIKRAEQYLNGIKIPSEKDIEFSQRILEKPLADIDYTQRRIKVFLEKSGFSLNLSCSSFPIDSLPQSRNWQFIGSRPLFRINNLEFKRWHQLDTQISLQDILPEDCLLLLDRFGDESLMYWPEKIIIVDDDITKIATILGLLHEIGHLNQFIEQLNAKTIDKMSKGLSKKEKYAREMKSEIESWNFAINLIKPLLDTKTKRKGYCVTLNEVINFIYGLCVASYKYGFLEELHDMMNIYTEKQRLPYKDRIYGVRVGICGVSRQS